MRPRPPSRIIALAIILGAASGDARPAFSQEPDGSTAAALAGGALGMGAGAMLASFGSVIPCSQTYAGPRCVRWTAAAGGAVGLTSGALLGAADAGRLGDVAVGAGIGFGVGSAVGLVLKTLAQRVTWADVGTVGLVGGAVGSAPRGAAFGLAAGGVVGLLLWQTVDGFKSPDALGAAVAGLAIGGITEWLVRGIDAQSASAPVLQMSVPLSVGF